MKWFNLTEQEKIYARNRTHVCIVLYDIVSNKRRMKLSKLLEGYGIRVQKSCFEVKIEEACFNELMSLLTKFFDEEGEDNILVYKSKEMEVHRMSTRQSEQLPFTIEII